MRLAKPDNDASRAFEQRRTIEFKRGWGLFRPGDLVRRNVYGDGVHRCCARGLGAWGEYSGPRHARGPAWGHPLGWNRSQLRCYVAQRRRARWAPPTTSTMLGGVGTANIRV
jgi:hypothetical protein